MPFLKIQTNKEISDSSESLKKLSSFTAEILGKPQTYVMTSLESNLPMTFGGSDNPLAFIECKSIGLSESQTTSLSNSLCSFCEKEFGIPRERIYIEFSSAKGNMWGWNCGTF